MPLNEYTSKIWEIEPKWKPKDDELIAQAKKE